MLRFGYVFSIADAYDCTDNYTIKTIFVYILPILKENDRKRHVNRIL
jgi:hypothetical protein